ncbi:MAG: M60 family metallopeptidase [Phycisphaerae bacterium]
MILRAFLILSVATLSTRADVAADRDAVMTGVTAVAAPGTPGAVTVFGESAAVLFDGPTGKKGDARVPVAGIASAGKGRVVAFGHDGYLKPDAWDAGQTARLFENLLKLTGKGKPRVAVVANRALTPALAKLNVDAQDVPAPRWRDTLTPGAKCDAVFLPPNLPANAEDAALLRAYVDAGGTAVLAVTGWAQKSLADHPGNRFLVGVGLAFAAATTGGDENDTIRPSKPISPALHVAHALTMLEKAGPAGAELVRGPKNVELETAGATLLRALTDLPADAEPIARLRKLAVAPNLKLPTFKKPLRQSDALARVALVASMRDIGDKPHPAAAEFPGLVPADAKRIERTIAVDTATPRWHSTGLYAAPGEPVTVALPPDAATKGLRLRIGAHTDKTYHLAAWRRAPEISKSFALDKPANTAANPFGGLIYVEVPKDSAAGTIDVKIANAVEAPLFVLGKTAVADWKTSIRTRPAPWAEIATDKLIITLKSEAIRTLDDPTAVLKHWDQVMDATATLAGWSIARKSPERMVCDADISAGYMHSGYPIMTGLDVTHTFVDLPKLRTLDGGWGFYHEVGHNHQHPDWTFDGTTEVTVNLFTMHTLETVCGVSKEDATSRAIGPKMQPKIKAYLARPDFDKWKSDPFLALAMYAQVRMAFGWEPFKTAIAEYRNLPANARPKTELEKHDQWMTRLSRACGKNLGPFFEAWGVPTSEAARKALTDLPGWMP